MGIFDFFKKRDINEGIQAFKRTQGAKLVDVRTPEEYASGHIENSINIPLQSLDKIEEIIQNKDTPIFVYCQSGGRSARSAQALRQMSYKDVRDLGGIVSYGGKIVQQ